MKSKMTRRELLKLAGIGSAGAILAACKPKVVEVTKIVEKPVEKVVTQVVEKEKVVTKVVEKVVVKTPAPREKVVLRIHTNQGDQWYGWMKEAWERNVGGWRSEHPYIELKFEPVAGWTNEYFPRSLHTLRPAPWVISFGSLHGTAITSAGASSIISSAT